MLSISARYARAVLSGIAVSFHPDPPVGCSGTMNPNLRAMSRKSWLWYLPSLAEVGGPREPWTARCSSHATTFSGPRWRTPGDASITCSEAAHATALHVDSRPLVIVTTASGTAGCSARIRSQAWLRALETAASAVCVATGRPRPFCLSFMVKYRTDSEVALVSIFDSLPGLESLTHPARRRPSALPRSSIKARPDDACPSRCRLTSCGAWWLCTTRPMCN
jgi:hypothetical protein